MPPDGPYNPDSHPCPACGDYVVWAVDSRAQWTPVDVAAHPLGTLALSRGWDGRPKATKPSAKLAFGRRDLHQPHASTCRKPRVLKEIGFGPPA